MAGDSANPLLSQKEITVVTQDGKERVYFISKIPAVPAREIMAKYPTSFIPKVGDYSVNEETMFKLMSYVAVPIKGREPQRLLGAVLINNHVPDWETLGQLELEMLKYNSSFFLREKASNFLDAITARIESKVLEMLTDLLPRSSTAAKQPSTNSKTSTP